MKKILSILVAALLSLLTCIPVCAAEKIDEIPGDTDFFVYAKYADNTGFTIISTDETGSGSITLPDGTEIAVSGARDTQGRIVVAEITDQEVLDWITEQILDNTSITKAYHVYHLDENGSSLPPTDGVTVTVRAKDGSFDSVYAVSDSQTVKLPSTAESGEITFITNSAYFYALCRDSGNHILPGENTRCALIWILLAIAAGGFTVILFFFIKKKKHSKA